MRYLAPLLYWPFFLAAVILIVLGVFSEIGTSYGGQNAVMIVGAVLWVVGWVIRYFLLTRGY